MGAGALVQGLGILTLKLQVGHRHLHTVHGIPDGRLLAVAFQFAEDRVVVGLLRGGLPDRLQGVFLP